MIEGSWEFYTTSSFLSNMNNVLRPFVVGKKNLFKFHNNDGL